MRYLSISVFVFLAACGSQERREYPDPWDDPAGDTPRRTYDEGYVSPSQMDADQLVARAHKAEERDRDDQARVDYQQAFRRDRWHPEANTSYQDLMLRNGLFDEVWQEYLDHWQQNPDRGDAFWFHLRPMLQKRGDAPMPLERTKKLSEETAAEVARLRGEARSFMEAGETDSALATVEAALKLADLTKLHAMRIALKAGGDYNALLEEYAERAEENPANGDNLYLHALVVFQRDANEALDLLRKGWILDVPGYWLRFGIAQFCAEKAQDQLESANTRDAKRSVSAYLTVAETFYAACAYVDESAAGPLQQLQDIRKKLAGK